MAAFKAVGLFLPQNLVEINPDAVESLKAFPFFTASVLADLSLNYHVAKGSRY